MIIKISTHLKSVKPFDMLLNQFCTFLHSNQKVVIWKVGLIYSITVSFDFSMVRIHIIFLHISWSVVFNKIILKLLIKVKITFY